MLILVIQSLICPLINASSQVVTPDSPSAPSVQQPPDSVSTSDTHTISSGTTGKQASIGMMEEESLAELMDALPDPENVFSDAV